MKGWINPVYTMPSKGKLIGDIFICEMRVRAAQRCFAGCWQIAQLEIQKMHYLELLQTY